MINPCQFCTRDFWFVSSMPCGVCGVHMAVVVVAIIANTHSLHTCAVVQFRTAVLFLLRVLYVTV
jgi:hypothetical protein